MEEVELDRFSNGHYWGANQEQFPEGDQLRLVREGENLLECQFTLKVTEWAKDFDPGHGELRGEVSNLALRGDWRKIEGEALWKRYPKLTALSLKGFSGLWPQIAGFLTPGLNQIVIKGAEVEEAFCMALLDSIPKSVSTLALVDLPLTKKVIARVAGLGTAFQRLWLRSTEPVQGYPDLVSRCAVGMEALSLLERPLHSKLPVSGSALILEGEGAGAPEILQRLGRKQLAYLEELHLDPLGGVQSLFKRLAALSCLRLLSLEREIENEVLENYHESISARFRKLKSHPSSHQLIFPVEGETYEMVWVAGSGKAVHPAVGPRILHLTGSNKGRDLHRVFDQVDRGDFRRCTWTCDQLPHTLTHLQFVECRFEASQRDLTDLQLPCLVWLRVERSTFIDGAAFIQLSALQGPKTEIFEIDNCRGLKQVKPEIDRLVATLPKKLTLVIDQGRWLAELIRSIRPDKKHLRIEVRDDPFRIGQW